jgi:hypothetical protein
MRRIGSSLMDRRSFAFRMVRQTWHEDYTQRHIEEVSLDRGDVSIVSYDAVPTTCVRACGAGKKPAFLLIYLARLHLRQLRGRTR